MSAGGSEDSPAVQLAAIRAAVEVVRRQGRAQAGDGGLADWSRAVTDVLLPAVQPVEGSSVLDVASGRGEPALRLAGLVGPSGRVVASDPSAADLGRAAGLAQERGVAHIDFCAARAESLPFPAGSFDMVTCQLGIALVADPAAALREMHRVVRPGGRVVLVSWGASGDSAVYAATIGVIGGHVGCREPEDGVPDPYRYGKAGALVHELRSAGFSAILEETAPVELVWAGSVDRLWDLVRATNQVIDPILGRLPSDRRSQIIEDVVAALSEHRRGDALVLPATVRVVSAVR